MRTWILTALTVCAVNAGFAQDMKIPYEKFQLENGLEVIVHEDHSDPVVAVYVVYHVGSAREQPGRSGFAHLFEHMLFQGSANVGDDKHFKYVSEAGGSLNGTTNRDRTLYYEVLPSSQLELALWLEADRMGFLLPAVTEAKLENQREVVKNERRQNYENRPYGRIGETLAAALFSPDHPYSWTTIGSMADLSAATLAIGGDVDVASVRALVERYFGPIPRGPEVARPEPRPTSLEQSRRLVIEDKVEHPRISIAWPGTTQFSEEDAALTLLSSILSANKSAVLDRALTIENLWAREVSASHNSGEMAGHFQIDVTAVPGITLDQLEQRVLELLSDLATKGIDKSQLERVKTRTEASFVRAYETVARRTQALAEYNVFLEDPGFSEQWLKRLLAVTPEQVNAALKKYLVGRPAVILSTVPEGKLDMAATGRTRSQLASEAELDRSKMPGPGEAPPLRSPAVWRDELPGGIRVTGTPYSEIPMTQFVLSLPAGRLRETMDSLGVSTLTAACLGEGTRELSTTELTDALDEIGATLSINSDDEEISISVNVLNRHLHRAVALVSDIVLEPRFDPADFERLKKRRLIAIEARGENIRSIAETAFARLLYGETSVLGRSGLGTKNTIGPMVVDDVRRFYFECLDPRLSRLTFVGNLDAQGVRALFAPLWERWQSSGSGDLVAATARNASYPAAQKTRIYLVDKPGAAQSEIRIGHRSVPSTHEDFYPLTVLNYLLGGTFSSRINLNLREDKGYTYGARSTFRGGLQQGPFVASSGVRTDVTAPAVEQFMHELNAIGEGVREDELTFARQSLQQANARRFESMRELSEFLNNVSLYDYPPDYPTQQIATLTALDIERLGNLAREYIHPDEMFVLVAGDKQVVLPALEKLDLGPIIELNIDGEPLGEPDDAQ